VPDTNRNRAGLVGVVRRLDGRRVSVLPVLAARGWREGTAPCVHRRARGAAHPGGVVSLAMAPVGLAAFTASEGRMRPDVEVARRDDLCSVVGSASRIQAAHAGGRHWTGRGASVRGARSRASRQSAATSTSVRSPRRAMRDTELECMLRRRPRALAPDQPCRYASPTRIRRARVVAPPGGATKWRSVVRLYLHTHASGRGHRVLHPKCQQRGRRALFKLASSCSRDAYGEALVATGTTARRRPRDTGAPAAHNRHATPSSLSRSPRHGGARWAHQKHSTSSPL